MNNFEKIKAMTLSEMAEFITTCARYHCIPLYLSKCGANQFDEENFLHAKEYVMKWLQAEIEDNQ